MPSLLAARSVAPGGPLVVRLDSALSDAGLIRLLQGGLAPVLGSPGPLRTRHHAGAFRFDWRQGGAQLGLRHDVSSGVRRLEVEGLDAEGAWACDSALASFVTVVSLEALVDAASYRPRSPMAIRDLVALAPSRPHPAVVRCLWDALDDPDPAVAQAALAGCLELGWPELDAPLMSMAASDTPVGQALRRGEEVDLVPEAQVARMDQTLAWAVLGGGVVVFLAGLFTLSAMLATASWLVWPS